MCAAIGMWTEMVPTVPIPDLHSVTAQSLADKITMWVQSGVTLDYEQDGSRGTHETKRPSVNTFPNGGPHPWTCFWVAV